MWGIARVGVKWTHAGGSPIGEEDVAQMSVSHPSRTKELIIRRHRENALLQTPTLSPVGRSRLDLTVDQPSGPPDPPMIEAAGLALDDGQTHYVDVPGIAPLREKLAGFLGNLGLSGYGSGNVIVAAGVQEARFLTIQTIGGLVGHVGVPEVVHPGARQAAGTRGLEIASLPVDLERGALPSLAGVERALADGCTLLYLESPVRLTGAAYEAAEVRRIGDLLAQYDAGVIWDQGLAPWATARYASLGAEAGRAERVAVVGEAWPGLGLEGWFLGYAGLPTVWFDPVRSLKQVISICTSTPSQYAALAAADLYVERHGAQRETLAGLRRAAAARAEEAGLRPIVGAAASVLTLRPPDAERAREALTEAGFGFADGAAFGAPETLRLAVTPDDAVAAAVSRLVAAVGGRKGW